MTMVGGLHTWLVESWLTFATFEFLCISRIRFLSVVIRGCAMHPNTSLTAKHLGDFLLVIIEPFSVSVTTEVFERILIGSRHFSFLHVFYMENFTWKWTSSTNHLCTLRQAVNALPHCRWQFLHRETLYQTFSEKGQFCNIKWSFCILSPSLAGLGKRMLFILCSLESASKLPIRKIELFCQALRLKCYEQKFVENWHFGMHAVPLGK